MSLDYERAALAKSKSKGTTRFVLMVLAYHANSKGQCWPLIETLVNETNSSRTAVNRAIRELKELGEIDTVKRGHGRPAIYQILLPPLKNKSAVCGTLDENKQADSGTLDKSISAADGTLDKSKVPNTGHKRAADGTQNYQELPIKKELSLKDEKNHLNNLASVLAEVCQVNIDTLSDKKRESLKSLVVTLARQDVTTDDIKAFGMYWTAHDWRGQKGQHPTPAQVGDEWGAFEASRGNKGRSPPNGHYYAGPPGLTDEQKQIIEQMRKDEGSIC